MRRAAVGVGVCVLALILAACAPVIPAAPAPRPLAVPLDAMMCASAFSGAHTAPAGRLPDDVEIDAVLRCTEWPLTDGADHRRPAIVVERLEGNLTAFLAAIGEPNEAAWQVVCPAIMEISPDLWAISADGRFFNLTRPVNACGQSKNAAVSDALGELDVVDERVVPLDEVASWDASGASCPAWATAMVLAPGKDDVTYELPDLADAADVATLRLCFYDAGESTDATFAGARELRSPDARSLVAALAAATATAEPCTVSATRLVVATPIMNGNSLSPPFTVEFDGCQRAIGPDMLPRAAPSELIALLTPLATRVTGERRRGRRCG